MQTHALYPTLHFYRSACARTLKFLRPVLVLIAPTHDGLTRLSGHSIVGRRNKYLS